MTCVIASIRKNNRTKLGMISQLTCLANLPNLSERQLTNDKTKLFFKCHPTSCAITRTCRMGGCVDVVLVFNFFYRDKKKYTPRPWIQGCAHFGLICVNSCAPHNAIEMEKFTPARSKTAKIHQIEYTPASLLVSNSNVSTVVEVLRKNPR